jgi:hypothetical protein
MPRHGIQSKVSPFPEFPSWQYDCRHSAPSELLQAKRLRLPLEASTLNNNRKKEAIMAAFDEHKDELEHFEQMMGPWRGRLAVTLDRLTDAMVLVGQHGVYCRSSRDPEKPALDIELVTCELRKAKELIQSVMEGLRAERGGGDLPLQ